MAKTRKLFEKTEKLIQKQKFDSALAIFLKFYEDQPQNEAVRLAELSLRLDRTEDSLRYYRLLTGLYIDRKDDSKDLASCRKILKIAP